MLFLLTTTTAVKAGDYIYTTNSDNTLTIALYTGYDCVVFIPSAIEGRTVTIIGDYAFSAGIFVPNIRLTSVTIPDSVVSIGEGAFSYRFYLTSIAIPKGVTNIGDWAFANDRSLTAITVNEGNSFYSSIEGVLFKKSQTILIKYPEGKAGSSYTIPDGVTGIGYHAFYSSTNLTSVAIPDSVTSIGDYAFDYCLSLTSITIPDSVTSIGDGAFYGSTNLTSVTIGNGVTNIGESAFDACRSLTAITVNEGNSVYSSIVGVLFKKSQTILIRYPQGKAGSSYTIPDGVTGIGDGAFYRSPNLTSITIPDSVTGIGHRAFYSSTNLTSVAIPDSVTSIGDYAFEHCLSLTSVTIGNGVTDIGDSAFNACFSLTSVTIGNGVTDIGYGAFWNCRNLMGVYFKGNAPNLGSYVFEYDNYATVYYLPETTGWGWTFGERPAMPWWDGPQISANNAREDLSLNTYDTLKIAVAMDTGNRAGVPVDWWVIARANNSGFYWYLNNSRQWTQFDGSFPNCQPAYQGGLFNFPATEVLNATGLPAGSYTFWFAVDYPMDGVLNVGGYILIDSVKVTVLD